MRFTLATALAVALIIIPLRPAPARGADGLEGAFRLADEAGWDFSRETLERALAGALLYSDRGVVIALWRFGDHPGTVNYLFPPRAPESAPGMAGLAWYTTYPAAEAAAARSLKRGMDRFLTRRHGPPLRQESEGDIREAKQVAADAGVMAVRRRKAFAEYEEKRQAGAGAEELRPLIETLESLMPRTYYRELSVHDAGERWAFALLTCGTDGGCYVHLYYAAKTASAAVGLEAEAGTGPTDDFIARETGRVGEANREWIVRLRRLGRRAAAPAGDAE